MKSRGVYYNPQISFLRKGLKQKSLESECPGEYLKIQYFENEAISNFLSTTYGAF